MLRSTFDAFLQERDVSLTLPQQRLCAVVLDAAERDAQLLELLTLPALGASFLFDLIDDFCTDCKHAALAAPPE